MASAAEKAYEVLKQRVIGGTYAPGAQLKEEHIARELEISRTPVRAALKRLVEDGLAIADPNRGVRVAEWTEYDIEERPSTCAACSKPMPPIWRRAAAVRHWLNGWMN
jgi:DNA-binding GntR family transcriptional regulator